MIRGLDVSAVQGVVPWTGLAREYAFAIPKAVQGNDGVDPNFARNAAGALAAGMHAFGYCFAYPLPCKPKCPGAFDCVCGRSPEWQAARFVREVYKHLPDSRIFVDFEWPEVVPSKPGGKGWREWGCSPPQMAEWLRRHCAEIVRLTGKRPCLYTYPWFWGAIRDGAAAYGFPAGGDVSWAADFDLWIAWYVGGHWPTAGASPHIPKPWTTWRFWQFDGNGGLRLPSGMDADFCVFNGDADALNAWARGECA